MKTTVLLSVATLLVLAGCMGGVPNPSNAPTAATGGDWCNEGESSMWMNPAMGQQVSWEVKGMTEYEGRDVCMAEWTSNEGRMVMYFTEDASYSKMVMYDAEGNEVSEYENVNVNAGDESRTGSSGGSTTAGSSSEWCAEGQTSSFANPQTGEQAKMEVIGVVSHDGRQTCKAVWTGNYDEGGTQRVEMYYDEGRDYNHMLIYDENGTLRYETKQDGDAFSMKRYDENGEVETEYSSSGTGGQ
ncbi:MAG: hypothetical protein SXQ77_07165 [Halobacteria archaeon]|nr:hypothetical protein [Halobacteria archaeon]